MSRAGESGRSLVLPRPISCTSPLSQSSRMDTRRGGAFQKAVMPIQKINMAAKA
jgi:hypothetical protein